MNKSLLSKIIATALSVFTLVEVNYPNLSPQTQLALFSAMGLVLCFIFNGLHPSLAGKTWAKVLDIGLAVGVVFCFLYIVVQTEPMFQSWWLKGQSLGNRAGIEHGMDHFVGVLGLVLVLEGARRLVGWALPVLAGVFLAYAVFGQYMPDWLFPHRGYGLERIVSQTFLHSQGVFGIALRVMFTYVFLFVLFGAFLESTGATQFVIDLARRLFLGSPGSAAKVAVLSSGLMGSLSGSAVANTATTGAFTIPMMRSSGFKPTVAAGIEAAASSGGALVPPVMGAGAYMMLEIIEPQVTYLQIIKAALIPAILYYVSLLLIAHLFAKKVGAAAGPNDGVVDAPESLMRFEGVVFFGTFFVLILLLVLGYTPFRAVSLAMLTTLVLSFFHQRTRLNWGKVVDAFLKTAKGGIPLIGAAACVGVVIGVVTLTGVGSKFPSAILPLAQENLLLALILIMVSSIVLGMGLPSAVCYLLMATLIGPVLAKLGVVPLAAHLFIFYFGMMSMVTPPVALAAYAAASIAGTNIMETGYAAFRFSLVGFALPFIFVYRPELLLLAPVGEEFSLAKTLFSLVMTLVGIVPLAAGVTGYLRGRLTPAIRAVLILAAALILYPGQPLFFPWLDFGVINGLGIVIFAVAGLRGKPKASL